MVNYLTLRSLNYALECHYFALNDTSKYSIDQLIANLELNRSLFDQWSGVESMRFIRNVTLLSGDDESFERFRDIASKSLKLEDEIEIRRAFSEFKDFDEEYGCQILARWINSKRVPITNLSLTIDEMLILVRHLKYLEILEPLGEDLTGELLANAYQLTELFIRDVDGNLLDKCPYPEKLKKLSIIGGDFNHSLGAFSHLEYLELNRCSRFNQSLSPLSHLVFVRINGCGSFNQSISKLSNLSTLEIFLCPRFNREISNLPNLYSLKVVKCKRFNNNIENLPVLVSSNIMSCPFNPFDCSSGTVMLMKGSTKRICYFLSILPPERKIMVLSAYEKLFGELQEKLHEKDDHGFSLLDYHLIPPAISLEETIPLIEVSVNGRLPAVLSLLFESYRDMARGKKTLDTLWMRICERYPRVARGQEDHPDLTSFIEEILASREKIIIQELLEWDYKMNPSLPMTGEGLRTILRLKNEFTELRTPLHLALQTHSSLEEIERAIRYGDITSSFPDKSEYFYFWLSKKEKRDLLCRALVMRERAAMPVVNQVIKAAVERISYDREMLLFSIRLLQATGLEGSSKTVERLQAILRLDFDLEIKGHAAAALAEVDTDLCNSESKHLLLRALDEKDPLFQKRVIDALEKYHFTKEDQAIAEKLIFLADHTVDKSVKISIAFALSNIPREDALRKSLDIVTSDIWNQEIQGYEKLGRKGSYMMYSYRPSFLDSRENMKRIIAERFVSLNRGDLAEEISMRMRRWKENPNQEPTLRLLAGNIRKIGEETRHVPFYLYLPEGKAAVRGICSRKGKALAESAVRDLIRRGAGSADLTDYDALNKGTWGKLGMVFSSISLGELFAHYFDEEGVLMAISGDALNEIQLRRSLRYEYEGSLNQVSYLRIRNELILHVFMNLDRKIEFKELGKRYIKKLQGQSVAISTMDKITMRSFTRKTEHAVPMKKKISYFSSECLSLKGEIQRLMEERNISLATLDEIIDENLERQIVREILAERIVDPALKECMSFASKVVPAVYQ